MSANFLAIYDLIFWLIQIINEQTQMLLIVSSLPNYKRLIVNYTLVSSKNIRKFFPQKKLKRREEEVSIIVTSPLYILANPQLRKYSMLLLSKEEMKRFYLLLRLHLLLNLLELFHFLIDLSFQRCSK